MVNSDKGITNLHVPSDVIVDASMPAMIRDSGKMWNAEGKLQDTKAVIPDRCYAGIYQAVIDDCKRARRVRPGDHGQRAQRRPDGAEGRGIRQPRQDLQDRRRRHRARDRRTRQGAVEQQVEAGDIWRMCQTKDAPIQRLGEAGRDRARLSNTPAVFWLDPRRDHDRAGDRQGRAYLKTTTPAAWTSAS
jgi:isocitrate dehydrogenase